jgi:glycosyltransferase involved in cell wall biosynthesis
MKILIVSTSDIDGGAARAAYRLHTAFLTQNIDSQMLVQTKKSDDPAVVVVKNTLSRFRPFLDSLPKRFYPNRTQTLFSPSWLPFSNTVDQINEINPDIVHLHWINGGMMSIEDLLRIKAPIVWSLHDMWAFTGGCHYDEHCGRYSESCGNCPVLESNSTNDLSHKIWERKERVFSQLPNITVVGLSRWITESAKKSSLFRDKKIITLPNPIDTTVFVPQNKQAARELWNLPKNKKLILFGAMSSTTDPRKGFYELIQSLQKLQRDDIEFIVFGSNETIKHLALPVHNIGYIHDDERLASLYSAADVMIVPSLQENLSNAIMESLACGTPVVAFDIGGNSDMVDHKVNGYLATPFDATDLANGIQWVLDTKNYDELCHNSHEKVVLEFDSNQIVSNYIDLYAKVLNA